MKKHIAALILIPALFCAACNKEPAKPASQRTAAGQPADLAPEGDKNMLPGGGWFIWKFSEKPKLGTIIVKVQAFDKDGKQAAPYEITGDSGMPSMPAHDSGPLKFQLNKKGDYLLPVNVVMPGEWRVIIKIKADKAEIYGGDILFSV